MPDEDDSLKRGMDHWQLECSARLQYEYGHDWPFAWTLASISRSLLEKDLRKPLSMIMITGA